MFGTLRTIMIGSQARAEERVRDVYALELIEQKIREAQAAQRAAKGTLASLIQRHRSEVRQAANVKARIGDLTKRAEEALADDNEDMAMEAAEAIATLENEWQMRRKTVERLEERISQLRQSVEKGHRRIIDLKQGLTQARAVRYEQQVQTKMGSTVYSQSSVEEAEELIANVVNKADPFEQTQILDEINRDLSHDSLTDRMADSGYGSADRTTGAEILKRLKKKK